MKISYRTHPALMFLDQDKPNIKCLADDLPYKDYILNSFDSTWKIYRHKFKNSQILLISEAFADAATKAKKKLIEAKLYENLEDYYGVILMDGLCYCYDFKRVIQDGKPGFEINLFVFSDKQELQGIIMAMCASDKVRFVSKICLDDNQTEIEVIKGLFKDVQNIVLFYKYAEIETKNLQPGQKLKEIDCNYKNDTSLPVKILDCKWFTTLVKSDAFKVRGHFRLQPKKKDGEWTKELIWISEFEKHGYTAPARKLKESIE